MKKTIIYSMLICLAGSACKKSELNQVNPNSPTQAALSNEQGITSYALGVFEKWGATVPNEGPTNIMMIAWEQHSIMGDELFAFAGNFGFRYANEVYSVTLPNGNLILTQGGADQKTSMQALNNRGAGDRNSYIYEWQVNTSMIAQMNTLQQALANPALFLAGDATTKKNTLLAWAYWWKGYAYSRIGSLYLSGVINHATDGTTNGAFTDHNGIIAEANKNFDSCVAILTGLQNNATYQAMMTAIIPSIFFSAAPVADFKNGAITPDMWVRQIYTYEARNLLVNKKSRDMTPADWTQLTALTAKGLQQADNIFVYAQDPNAVNDLTIAGGFGSPYVTLGSGGGFMLPSERLIQDFKPGDVRLTKGFKLQSPSDWLVNVRGRGLQFGTRYAANNIENGGLYATDNNSGIINLACTWDENALMKAEALIRSGSDIEGGLGLIDAVRNAQGAGLPAVKGTGLSQVQAIEELRKERRIGLFMRGVAFYDARRWGVTEPFSTGGGRTNANVLIDAPTLGGSPTSPAMLVPCTMDYRYLDYWDVPQNELDFNTPGKGSAPVIN